MECGRAVLCGILVATAGSQLRDSLVTNVQGIGLLSDDVLRHNPAQVLYQKPHTLGREGEETLTLLPIEGPECADPGSEPVCG